MVVQIRRIHALIKYSATCIKFSITYSLFGYSIASDMVIYLLFYTRKNAEQKYRYWHYMIKLKWQRCLVIKKNGKDAFIFLDSNRIYIESKQPVISLEKWIKIRPSLDISVIKMVVKSVVTSYLTKQTESTTL